MMTLQSDARADAELDRQLGAILEVAQAVARGDLSRKIALSGDIVDGPVAELAQTIDAMVGQLSGFASEVIRVARELGTEGRLGGQATVPHAEGIWRDITDSVNSAARNLTAQVRDIAGVTTAVAQGDLTQKITVEVAGEMLELKDTINTMVDQLSGFADEVTRVSLEVGTEGRLGGQARVPGVAGTWKDLTDSVNSMADNLTTQVRNIAQVATAVASGDLTQTITVDARGEILELKTTLNKMVDRLGTFADEVTRVAREVGTEGKLGGQATVRGVAGTWKDLTDNVNAMANNLTSQVRNIAQVTTAVANGDLTRRIDVEARGEILELKTTLNTMVDRLSAFASEVTRVAREVGTEGKLGGQATVEDVSGTWQRLTESVNELASNLTTQVRAIAEVATAVTAGDLTRLITVETKGEVADLKNNINQMIGNLRETTRRNDQQDWLNTNLARMSGMMQGQRDLDAVSAMIMSELTPLVNAQYGAFYLARKESGAKVLNLIASYGVDRESPDVTSRFRLGQGLVGQAAVERKPIMIQHAPVDYIRISSGLGSAPPSSVAVLPVLFENEVMAVIELASFHSFDEVHRALLESLMEMVGVTVNTITANTRTEELLGESRRLADELKARTDELQNQQKELRRSNAELEEKAELLARQNQDIEVKNSEIEQARQELEERANQLTMSSRYKSEFLANMSHELRTPLNSLLILARLMADNAEGNLTERQVEYAETIHGAGSDLLQLINDILDLSKIEAGRMDVQPARIAVSQLVDYVEATFRPQTEQKGLELRVRVHPSVPAHLFTDEQRLQQVLRNLLSNSVKFTETGHVELVVDTADDILLGGPEDSNEVSLGRAVSFAVSDTGIGIVDDKIQTVFEAFQQEDGTTSRRYGGTGLGLSISREIAKLLGGGIRAESQRGRGSTFTLFLPHAVGPEGGAVFGSTASLGYGTSPIPAAILAAEPSPTLPLIPVQGPHPDLYLPSTELYAAGSDITFDGEKILIVDDDIRNVFALTSVLEQHGCSVLNAENGRAGLEALERADDVALVLMDVMMPEMDGYATMAAIREIDRYKNLPIIALTAKAMRGDREKSIEAGASDYVTKPVDTPHLLTVMRGWLDAETGVQPTAGGPTP
ncbi:HAMP domain-containing protein [Catenulispora pinisilvae]|uniref:HAMP domain-containing protein n=1 Tax=Catenulispora pinisilvae TaxID=2705253 RepID=UPI003F6971B9